VSADSCLFESLVCSACGRQVGKLPSVSAIKTCLQCRNHELPSKPRLFCRLLRCLPCSLAGSAHSTSDPARCPCNARSQHARQTAHPGQLLCNLLAANTCNAGGARQASLWSQPLGHFMGSPNSGYKTSVIPSW
jgi:hypothetical protein